MVVYVRRAHEIEVTTGVDHCSIWLQARDRRVIHKVAAVEIVVLGFHDQRAIGHESVEDIVVRSPFAAHVQNGDLTVVNRITYEAPSVTDKEIGVRSADGISQNVLVNNV